MAYWSILPDEIRKDPNVTGMAVLLDKYGYLMTLEEK